MSAINEFAKDLVKRQIQIYKENKSKNFDMTQPLSVLICCSIIIFSDYIEKYENDSLIERISDNDATERKLQKFIERIYENKISERLKSYSYNRKQKGQTSFINEKFKDYEVFFHDLRNEFAHIIETTNSKLEPNTDGNFNRVIIRHNSIETHISKEQIIDIIDCIDNSLK